MIDYIEYRSHLGIGEGTCDSNTTLSDVKQEVLSKYQLNCCDISISYDSLQRVYRFTFKNKSKRIKKESEKA